MFTGPCFSNAPQPHELIRARFGPEWMLVVGLWLEMGGRIIFCSIQYFFLLQVSGEILTFR